MEYESLAEFHTPIFAQDAAGAWAKAFYAILHKCKCVVDDAFEGRTYLQMPARGSKCIVDDAFDATVPRNRVRGGIRRADSRLNEHYAFRENPRGR
jgi:hypothetical protein